MLELDLDIKRRRSFSILCLGAHSDDIEIGCGGTILKLLANHPNISVSWVVFSAEGPRRSEAKGSARRFLRLAQHKTVAIKKFRGSFFPYIGNKIKEEFEQLKRTCKPDLILTHYRHDLHQDHRIICDLTWNTFRDHLILEYEIPKYDGDMGTPNVFSPLNEDICRDKIHHLLESFQTQRAKHWFTEDTFMSLLRIRGIESGPQTTYAEAFYCRKLVLSRI